MFADAGRNVLLVAVFSISAIAATAGAEITLERVDGWPYAGARAVAVDADRDLIYLGSGGAILALDVTDPSAPQLLHDGLHTDGHVRDLRYVAENKRLYVADWRSGLEIWDLQDPQNPVRLSSVPVYYSGTNSDQPTDGLSITGDYLYINANEARVHAFDISDAANPIDLGVQAGPLWYYSYERDTDDVAAVGGYVYVAGSGLAKYRILADGTLDKVGENLYTDGVTCIEVQGAYAYAGVSQGLGVFDVSGPNPSMVGSTAVSEGLNDLALTGDFVVAVNRNGLFVFDVSTPQQPQQIASLPLPDGHRVRLDGDVAYVSSDAAGLQVIDISDAYDPVLLGSYDTVGTTSAVTVVGDSAFLGQGTDGLVITDVSNPSAVQVAGRSDGVAATESLLIGDHLYVSDWYSPALRVFDVSDVSSPIEVGGVDDFTAVDLATDGEVLFVTRFSVDTQLYYLHVFDLADPTSPVELSTIPLSPHILEVEYANDHLFAIEFYDTGLHIINVSDPSVPFEDAYYPVDWGEDVWIQGNLAYVTAFHDGLLVLDISEPANPTLAGSVNEIFQFDSVAVSGDLAFITTGTTGEHHLRLYDVSDVSDIRELDRIALPGNAWDLTAQGNYAYVADGITGLQIIRAGTDAGGLIFTDDFESGGMTRWLGSGP